MICSPVQCKNFKLISDMSRKIHIGESYRELNSLLNDSWYSSIGVGYKNYDCFTKSVIGWVFLAELKGSNGGPTSRLTSGPWLEGQDSTRVWMLWVGLWIYFLLEFSLTTLAIKTLFTELFQDFWRLLERDLKRFLRVGFGDFMEFWRSKIKRRFL